MKKNVLNEQVPSLPSGIREAKNVTNLSPHILILKEPKNRSQRINSVAWRDSRFLASIDCIKIPVPDSRINLFSIVCF